MPAPNERAAIRDLVMHLSPVGRPAPPMSQPRPTNGSSSNQFRAAGGVPVGPPGLARQPGSNWRRTRCVEAMRRRILLVLLSSLFLCAGAGAAQDLRPLQRVPELPACRSTGHPQLPQHWRATYLMAPFTTGQLVLAEIVQDAPLAATRVTLYGVKLGRADFLVTANTT